MGGIGRTPRQGQVSPALIRSTNNLKIDTCVTGPEGLAHENSPLHGGRIGGEPVSSLAHHRDIEEVARDDSQKQSHSLPSPSPLSPYGDCRNSLDPVLHCTPLHPHQLPSHPPSVQPCKPPSQGGNTLQPHAAHHYGNPSLPPLSCALCLL